MMNQICNIKVIGVGGAGNNAVERMINAGITSAKFVSVNTDQQALLMSTASEMMQIGKELTRGLGAGANPEIGEKAAIESKDDIVNMLQGTDLVFITAGMGGGTGTGAAPVIAQIAKDMDILTVAVVTKPFEFEGKVRKANAERGIENLRKYVDTLVTIPNEKLYKILKKGTSIVEAFRLADDVLRQGIQGVADVIATPSMINLDFADVSTIMKNKGLAHMGIGHGKGENKTIEAVRQAVTSQLLETSIEGANGILLNIKGGVDLPLHEVYEAVALVREAASPDVNLIFGASIDEKYNNEVEITVIATDFDKDKELDVPFELPEFKDNGRDFVSFVEHTENNSEVIDVEEDEDEIVAEVEDITDAEEMEKGSHIKVENPDLPAFLQRLKR